ncbi:MAG TPA: universal stress protein [Ilumatobacteraceae bacterium]|nr:universal stress protein [Ilumatobacteraceae bacterium]
MATRTWIVGVDGSDHSRTALAWATAQAVGRDVEIVALSTWRAPILPSDAIGQPALLMDWSQFEAEFTRRVDEIIASTRHDAESTPAGAVPAIVPRIVPRIEQGRPAHLLIEASRDAELLVVGSQGRSGLSGVVLGSVSRQCATHATVPVVVVPPDVASTPVEHVVVGFDGSRNARAALRWALAFSNADADIVVVRSVELAPWMDEAGVRERFPVEVDKALTEFESELAELDPGGRARRTFKLQDARQALAEAASGADMVVLGARGHRRFAATLLGSVSTWMLHGASCATVIVPDPST